MTAPNIWLLTPRELEVLNLLPSGDTNKHIARKLNIEEGTVKHHITNIIIKSGIDNRTRLAVEWTKLHLTPI